MNKDRLIKEMRLAGVSSIAEGNACLQSWLEPFNEKFAVAAESEEDGHRPFPAGVTPQSVFRIEETRKHWPGLHGSA